MKLLEGKVAVITGATRGIGKGIAMKFAEQGANIAFTYVSSAEKAKEVENQLKEFNVKAIGYQSNAGDFNQAQELVDSIVSEFGQIDVLINNAGITKDGLLMRMSEQDWDDIIVHLQNAISESFDANLLAGASMASRWLRISPRVVPIGRRRRPRRGHSSPVEEEGPFLWSHQLLRSPQASR